MYRRGPGAGAGASHALFTERSPDRNRSYTRRDRGAGRTGAASSARPDGHTGGHRHRVDRSCYRGRSRNGVFRVVWIDAVAAARLRVRARVQLVAFAGDRSLKQRLRLSLDAQRERGSARPPPPGFREPWSASGSRRTTMTPSHPATTNSSTRRARRERRSAARHCAIPGARQPQSRPASKAPTTISTA